FAYCSHLRTVVRVDTRSEDITSAGRSYLIQEILVHHVCLLLLIITILTRSTVISTTATQCRRYTWAEETSQSCSTQQTDLRLFLTEKAINNSCMGQGSIRLKSWVITYMYDICPIGKEFFFNSIQFATQHDGFKFTFKPVGQTASFGKEFEADI